MAALSTAVLSYIPEIELVVLFRKMNHSINENHSLNVRGKLNTHYFEKLIYIKKTFLQNSHISVFCMVPLRKKENLHLKARYGSWVKEFATKSWLVFYSLDPQLVRRKQPLKIAILPPFMSPPPHTH